MQSTFEAEKNKRAFLYTVIIMVVLLLLAILITWPIMDITPPLAEDLIEVNLGNDYEGFGEVQPLIKGEAGQLKEENQPQPKQQAAAPDNNIQPDDAAENDAAPIEKPNKPSPKVTPVPTPPVTKPVKTKTPAPVKIISPKPPKPKAVMNGPTHGTGNNSPTDNGFKDQGKKPGKHGDDGIPTGLPDSYGNHPGGKSGVSVTRGAKPLNMGDLRFEDDFSEDATVYLDVYYDANGKYTRSGVSVQTKGTSTSSPAIIGIAKRKAALLKFPANNTDGGFSTILFRFRIKN